jgi:hypothetical protein
MNVALVIAAGGGGAFFTIIGAVWARFRSRIVKEFKITLTRDDGDHVTLNAQGLSRETAEAILRELYAKGEGKPPEQLQ